MQEKTLKVEVSMDSDCVPTIGSVYYFDAHSNALLLCAYYEDGCILIDIKNPMLTYIRTEEVLLHGLKSGAIKKVPDGTKIIITT